MHFAWSEPATHLRRRNLRANFLYVDQCGSEIVVTIPNGLRASGLTNRLMLVCAAMA
jgi:hypothetical protein